jgi:hypothetical protein
VVAQPPFVIQPPDLAATTYLHGGAKGDVVTRRLLSELPGVMAPGGRALVLYDAPAGEELEPLAALPAGHLTLAVVAPGASAEELAISYASLEDATLGRRYEAAVQRYLDHFAHIEVTRVDHVLVDIRAHADDEVVRVPRQTLEGLSGAAVIALESAVDAARLADDELLARTVSVDPRARLVVERRLSDGSVRASLQLPDAARGEHALSDGAAALIELLAEPRPLRDSVVQWAAAVEAEPHEVRSTVLGFVRDALTGGLVVVR